MPSPDGGDDSVAIGLPDERAWFLVMLLDEAVGVSGPACISQPLSMDLRTRLLFAIDAGMSCRSAAERFGVAPSTAIRWQARRRTTGNFAPKPRADINI